MSAEPLLLTIASPAWEVDCSSDCATAVAIHTTTGEVVAELDFDGYPNLLPAPRFPGRAIVYEWGPGDRLDALHLIDAPAATSTKLLEFDGFRDFGILGQPSDASPWLSIYDAQGEAPATILVDLRDGTVRRFDGTAPSFDATESLVALNMESSVVVYDTESFSERATIALAAGQRLVGLSPDGSAIATAQNDFDALAMNAVTVTELDGTARSELLIDGFLSGWYNADRLLVADEGSAQLIDSRTGESTTPIPSLRLRHPRQDASTRWHVSEFGDEVVITDIETGEQRSMPSENDTEEEYAITPGHQQPRAWAGLNAVNGSTTLGLVFLDLEAGEIAVYRDHDYEGFVWSPELALSPDRTQALIPGVLGPGLLLGDGEIVESAVGQPYWCADGSRVFGGRPSDDRPGRNALYFGESGEAIVLGNQPHVHCV